MENTTSLHNSSRLVSNLALVGGIVTAIALFMLTIQHIGIFNFASRPEIPNNSGSILVETENFAFTQDEIRFSAGSEITLELWNSDVIAHSFDVDELDLHILMPIKEQATATLTLSEPGTYIFYCAIPGHHDAGMVGKLIIE